MDLAKILKWIADASAWLSDPANEAAVAKVIDDLGKSRDPISRLWTRLGKAFGEGEAA
ncbi:MAG: hypothetical protein AAGA68_26475 [Pseudomonadota bacterium]